MQQHNQKKTIDALQNPDPEEPLRTLKKFHYQLFQQIAGTSSNVTAQSHHKPTLELKQLDEMESSGGVTEDNNTNEAMRVSQRVK